MVQLVALVSKGHQEQDHKGCAGDDDDETWPSLSPLVRLAFCEIWDATGSCSGV